jgi:outer membrane cobalamin receptor
MSTQEKAWHKPNLTAGFETYFIIKTRLTLSMYFTANSGMYAKTYSGNEVRAELMKGWLDLGLGAEYRITDRFSAFLKLNNLLNQGYERWYNYPVQGLNVLAGVGFSF